MVKVRFFGIARIKFKEKEIQIESSNVKELLQKIAERYNITLKDAKQFLIYVNDVNITDLKVFRTPLKDGDEVIFLSPSSGG